MSIPSEYMPMPLYHDHVRDALNKASNNRLTDDQLKAYTRTLISGGAVVKDKDPMAFAIMMARAWAILSEWRQEDHRARACVITVQSQDASLMRDMGIDAFTSFAISDKNLAAEKLGLLIAIDHHMMLKPNFAKVISLPSKVRTFFVSKKEEKA